MASTGKKWLIGCGAGCGGLLVLGIVVSIGGGLLMMRPMNKAVDTQKMLDAEYGKRDTYVPAAAGITTDRMKKFLAVRRAVMPMCEKFLAMAENFRAFDDIDESEEEPSKTELFSAMARLSGGMFGIVGNLGDFTYLRNEALLAQRMSLGEYAWIYTLAYNSWLGHPPNTSFEDEEGGHHSPEERATLQKLARNHAEALAAAGNQAAATMWQAEAERMERADTGVPFSGTAFPPDLQAVLAPYRAQLEELFCAPMASFELSQVRKEGLSVTAD